MTLRHMKIFVAVYQQKSITLASNSLHLAQPSVSLAIKELEEYYHIRLFDRLSRRIYPTENGHRFYEYALHIVSLFSEMENKIPAWDSVSTLALIRAAQNGLGIAILPELLVRDALKSGDLVSLPLPPDILTHSLYLIRHRNKYLSSSAEEFQNLCRMWKF